MQDTFVAFQIAGNQQPDMMVVSLEGIPPEESRTIWVYLRQGDGTFPATPNHSASLPLWERLTQPQ
jgi:hypothetical protein